MHYRYFGCLSVSAIAASLVVLTVSFRSDSARAEDDQEKAVVVFDLVSKYDEGHLGQKEGDAVAAKIKRQGEFLITEMVDMRDLCESSGIKITPETSLEKVKEAVRGTFDAQIGIWGQVELAPGAENEIYDITLKCVDFSGSEPKVIYDKTARTNSAAEIPHLYIKEMLDKLYGREPGAPPVESKEAAENWKNNPNLIVGGDFEKGSNGVPKGWEPRCGQQREPLGRLVAWVPEAGNSQNKVIRFNLDRGTAEGTGAPYYSDGYFPVEEGATYRFQIRFRTNGPSPKIFIKCYDDIPTDFAQGYEPPPDSPTFTKSSGGGKKVVYQRREVYRSQQNLKEGGREWVTHTEDFTPKHTKYSPKFGKVDIYCYLSPGVAEFDDVVIKQIIPASPGDKKKVLRHSLDTKVTIDEMKANEARGDEARKGLVEPKKKSPSKKAASTDE